MCFGISEVSVGMWKGEKENPHAHTQTHEYIYEKMQWKPSVFPKTQKYGKPICFNYDDIKWK